MPPVTHVACLEALHAHVTLQSKSALLGAGPGQRAAYRCGCVKPWGDAPESVQTESGSVLELELSRRCWLQSWRRRPQAEECRCSPAEGVFRSLQGGMQLGQHREWEHGDSIWPRSRDDKIHVYCFKALNKVLQHNKNTGSKRILRFHSKPRDRNMNI